MKWFWLKCHIMSKEGMQILYNNTFLKNLIKSKLSMSEFFFVGPAQQIRSNNPTTFQSEIQTLPKKLTDKEVKIS